MDGIIQMLPPFLRKYSTYVDFEGQSKSERIFQVIFFFDFKEKHFFR